MTNNKILIVDDEEWIRNQLKWALSSYYDVHLADSVDKALEILNRERPDLVMLDISLTPEVGTGSEGIKLLQDVLSLDSTIKVIMITGNDTKENALKCISLGAYDFYSKPINLEEIKVSIKRALYNQSLERENRRLQESLRDRHEFADIISNCEQMDAVLNLVRRVATTDVTVLIQGESGTGKELIAKAIHYNSNRKDKPFIIINCGAIPENLLESELFGHEKGAFTDAHQQRIGKLELAKNGTVFLDEIGDLTLPLQVKILRFLQEKEIERVGGRERIQLDVRVITATNKNLLEEVAKKTFRDDLYYRLSVISISLPPLRERGDDVILLANAFLRRFSEDIKSGVRGFSDDSLSALKAYNWPGNIRELENKVRRAMIIAQGHYITPEDLDLPNPRPFEVSKELRSSLTLKEARERLESQYIKEAIMRNNGNIIRTAEEIGVTRSNLYSLIDKYKIKI